MGFIMEDIMVKEVIVINGKGGVGKDTLCNIISSKYNVLNVSAVDPIKAIAKQIGWKGEKDAKSRKMLSDLKRLTIEYNDFPNRYLCEKYDEFLKSDYEIMFVHIREPEQIAHFVSSVSATVKTLLISRSDCCHIYGNYSDDNVANYQYDYYYENSLPLSDVALDFITFFENAILNIVPKVKE